MINKDKVLKIMAPILVYGRPPLIFAVMICAISVMLNRSPGLYFIGGVLFFISMIFDLVDGWFAERFIPNTTLAQLADRMMNRIVYTIVFPMVAVGMMWRLIFMTPGHGRIHLLHAVFVLILCVAVLIRDNFAHFMRGFAIRYGQEPELRELNRLRTIVAAPLGLILYIYAFHVPESGAAIPFYEAITWLANVPVQNLIIVEILFLIINFASIAGYCRKYGTYFLNDVCLDDNLLRRRILSVFPNALTLMNAIMGLLAVFFAYQAKMLESYLFIMGAAVFDKLDGAMARKLGLTEPAGQAECPGGGVTFGGLLDDVADGVSFCIAPAWIFYISVSYYPDPGIQALPLGFAALVYLVAGFVRLIYFTRDPEPIPGIFKGMPTPAAALFVTAPLILLGQVRTPSLWGDILAFFSFALMFGAAVLMNMYPVKYIHMGRFMDRNPWFTWTMLILLFIFVFTPYFGYVAFILILSYVFSPFATQDMNPETAARETREE